MNRDYAVHYKKPGSNKVWHCCRVEGKSKADANNKVASRGYYVLESKTQRLKGTFDMKHFLATLAMIVLVFMFVGPSYAQTEVNVALAWDANSEEDLAGYKIYYKTGTSGEPYDGTGAVQGDSPITVLLGDLTDSTAPEYLLTGLPDGEYYFALTAFDESDNESGYSTEVSAVVDATAPDIPTGVTVTVNISISVN